MTDGKRWHAGAAVWYGVAWQAAGSQGSGAGAVRRCSTQAHRQRQAGYVAVIVERVLRWTLLAQLAHQA